MKYEELKINIEKAFLDTSLCENTLYQNAIEETIRLLDLGELRVVDMCEGVESEPIGECGYGQLDASFTSDYVVNEWVKKAILLYFRIKKLKKYEFSSGDIEFWDKIPLKNNYEALGVRAVPLAVARYGSFLDKGVVLMPSYVNIGARVGKGTMVDTWATVGSCAQIGEGVHLSGGVGIGGVLEPLQASPVIIENDCFIGSRSIIVEGIRVCKEAVIGANVCITASTKIIDVTEKEPKYYKGYIPERSVVIPGVLEKEFPAGKYSVPCALIIGKRKESTDKKISLNNALRDFSVAV